MNNDAAYLPNRVMKPATCLALRRAQLRCRSNRVYAFDVLTNPRAPTVGKVLTLDPHLFVCCELLIVPASLFLSNLPTLILAHFRSSAPSLFYAYLPYMLARPSCVDLSSPMLRNSVRLICFLCMFLTFARSLPLLLLLFPD